MTIGDIDKISRHINKFQLITAIQTIVNQIPQELENQKILRELIDKLITRSNLGKVNKILFYVFLIGQCIPMILMAFTDNPASYLIINMITILIQAIVLGIFLQIEVGQYHDKDTSYRNNLWNLIDISYIVCTSVQLLIRGVYPYRKFIPSKNSAGC